MDNVKIKWRYELTSSGERGILQVVNGYAICPQCGKKKIARITPDTELSNVGLWCRICGEVNISITPER